MSSSKSNKNNVVKQSSQVTLGERCLLLKQRPLTVWFTGLSGAGKSTLAYALEKALLLRGHACYVLDGDNLRHGLNEDLGFSLQDRSENIRRVAEVAKLMNDAGLIVISAFISPLEADRLIARSIVGDRNFFEIYVSTPIEECERRDPKGLYEKARVGEILDFTGVSSPYEVPPNPKTTIDTSHSSLEGCLSLLTNIILQHTSEGSIHE